MEKIIGNKCHNHFMACRQPILSTSLRKVMTLSVSHEANYVNSNSFYSEWFILHHTFSRSNIRICIFWNHQKSLQRIISFFFRTRIPTWESKTMPEIIKRYQSSILTTTSHVQITSAMPLNYQPTPSPPIPIIIIICSSSSSIQRQQF